MSANIVLIIQIASIWLIQFIFQNGGFEDLLYSSDWYVLPVKCQLTVVQLINEKQNRQRLTMGPFSDLDLELFYVVSLHSKTVLVCRKNELPTV